jgi:hypothetical protein
MKYGDKDMKIDRTKNAARSMLFGIILRIHQIMFPFLMRTLMIYLLGAEYLGLNSLFVSVLQVLNLAELGIGSAMVFSMYKPIVEDDTYTICALMNLYKRYYRLIGKIILVAGLVVVPFLPKLISKNVPGDINIYILYLMNLAATVLTYWLYSYKICLLYAHQRTDIVSKISLGINTIQYLLQILAILFFQNYYFYVAVLLFTQVITNIVTALFTDKIYPRYKAYGNLSREEEKDINHRIRDLFTSKIEAVIINSVDSIFISAYLGLTVLAVYNNYYYILTSIIGFINIIFYASTAGIGNSIIVETEDKNYNDFNKMTFIIAWITGCSTCCLICLYQHFMRIWVGNKLMLSFAAVICFCVYFFVYEINSLFTSYKDAAGMWHEDRFRPLVTALSNLILNFLLIQKFGVFGVLFSTIISTLVIGFPWLSYNLFSIIFKRSPWRYLRRLLLYISVTLITCFLVYFVCDWMPDNGIGWFALKMILCAIFSNLIFLIMLHKLHEFKEVKLMAEPLLNKIYFYKIINKRYKIFVEKTNV